MNSGRLSTDRLHGTIIEVKRYVRSILRRAAGKFSARRYWDERYRSGEDSGSGSREFNWQFKTDYINSVIERYAIRSITDFGCGDGMQIRDLQVREYLGLDISSVAVKICRKLYSDRPNWRFEVLGQAELPAVDLALSLDVLYHVVDRDDFVSYLQRLFGNSKYVLVYANYSERVSNAAHAVYRDNLREIAAMFPRAHCIERHAHPGKADFGFALFLNN